MPGKRSYSSAFPARITFSRPKYARTRTTSVLPRARGQLRTGGNYSYVRRYYDNRTGAYRVGSGPERKFIDDSADMLPTCLATGANSGGDSGGWTAPHLINALSQGTDAINRLGRKVMMKSIQCRVTGQLQSNVAGVVPAGMTAGAMRMIIVYDSQANGAAPLNSDIMASVAQDSVISPMNLNNRERFKVIYDKTRILDPSGPGAFTYKLYKKVNLPEIFNAGNAGTVADIQTGSLWIMAAMTNQATAAATFRLNVWTRVRFVDD